MKRLYIAVLAIISLAGCGLAGQQDQPMQQLAATAVGAQFVNSPVSVASATVQAMCSYQLAAGIPASMAIYVYVDSLDPCPQDATYSDPLNTGNTVGGTLVPPADWQQDGVITFGRASAKLSDGSAMTIWVDTTDGAGDAANSWSDSGTCCGQP